MPGLRYRMNPPVMDGRPFIAARSRRKPLSRAPTVAGTPRGFSMHASICRFISHKGRANCL